jgi:hypothetical protein
MKVSSYLIKYFGNQGLHFLYIHFMNTFFKLKKTALSRKSDFELTIGKIFTFCLCKNEKITFAEISLETGMIIFRLYTHTQLHGAGERGRVSKTKKSFLNRGNKKLAIFSIQTIFEVFR